jgi:beta-lactam-binding protein with PASTA domain
LKFLSVVVALFVAMSLSACGGSDSTTSAGDSSQVEALQLEKEKAEIEAETAKAEAQKEARAAQKQARMARQAAKKAAQAKAAAATESAPEPEPEPEEVPSVVGMRLPEAKSTLSAAGYRTQAENTDTAFGIVVPSHYTICEQSEPHGDVVTVLAQKYGC